MAWHTGKQKEESSGVGRGEEQWWKLFWTTQLTIVDHERTGPFGQA